MPTSKAFELAQLARKTIVNDLTDVVTITDLSGGGGGASALDDLSDVALTTLSAGEVLKYDGSNWVNDSDDTGTTVNNLDDIGDVIITAAATGQVLKYDGTNWINSTDDAGTTISGINDIGDVVITTATTGQVLKYDGTNWINSTDSTGTTISGINDIGDVVITSVATGQVLKYDGTNWVNGTDTAGTTATFTVVSSNTTASANTFLLVDTTSAGVTVTLPPSPANGDFVTFGDGGGDKVNEPTTVARNGNTIQGSAADYVLNTPNHRVTFVWSGTTWRLIYG